jgi:hypothetical protein
MLKRFCKAFLPLPSVIIKILLKNRKSFALSGTAKAVPSLKAESPEDKLQGFQVRVPVLIKYF